MAAASVSRAVPVFEGLRRAAAPSSSGRGCDALRPAAPSPSNPALFPARKVTAMSLKDLRDRIGSVKNTQKITDAMKLVAAAKVRRAQEAVVKGRPFSEQLVKVLYGVNGQLRVEDVESPLTVVRPVKRVCLVIVTGDRGLCGGFNTAVIRKGEQRARELVSMGVEVTLVLVGKKGITYFSSPMRNEKWDISKGIEVGQAPTAKEAQALADSVYSYFLTEYVDKVELVYSRFISLIKSNPVIHTLLPLSPAGEVCDIDGNCVDASEDELFRLTTKEGKFAVEREKVSTVTEELDANIIFEQEPAQILDALLPLYLNSQVLRALQESLASELAARMNAMGSASDNASELSRILNLKYNRQRQAKITGELIEIVSGSNA
eukprot:jgi/Chlat1/9229/Chrsp99S08507